MWGRLRFRRLDERPAYPEGRTRKRVDQWNLNYVKGKFGWDFVNSEDRLTSPLIRRYVHNATWDEALQLIACRLTEIKAKDGPDSSR